MKSQVNNEVVEGVYYDKKFNQFFKYDCNGWSMTDINFISLETYTKAQSLRLGEIIFNYDCLTLEM